MSELTPATHGQTDHRWLHLEVEPPAHTRLDCDGCPVAAGDVPDASCAECVVSVFLAAEPWTDDGAS